MGTGDGKATVWLSNSTRAFADKQDADPSRVGELPVGPVKNCDWFAEASRHTVSSLCIDGKIDTNHLASGGLFELVIPTPGVEVRAVIMSTTVA